MSDFKTAIQDFIRHCRFEKNLSSKTIKAYNTDLAQLTLFLIEKKYSLQLLEITKIELRHYLEHISPLKPKSIKRKVATIRTLFNYLEFEDKIIANPLRKLRIKIKEQRLLPKTMDIKEINKIFKSAYKEIGTPGDIPTYSYTSNLRNVAVVELLFATGARVSELSNLKDENINLLTGAITLRGKGNKERIIQICNQESLKVLRDYHRLFKDKSEKADGYFLINRLGKKLSDQSIRMIVKNLAVSSGIQKHITPHMFRHSFATLLLEKDVDIKYIQSLLGHSSIMTTQIYTHVNREKQVKILKTKHPRKDFSMLPVTVS